MEKKLKNRVIKNSFWSFATGAISRVGALIFSVLLARILLPEGFGIYSIVISIAMVAYTFADLGIGQTLTRYLSYSLAKEKNKAYSYYFYLLKLKFLLALVSSGALLLLSYPLSFFVFKNPSMFLPLVLSSVYTFILSFDLFYTQVFYSVEKFKYLTIKEIINQASKILLSIPLFYLAILSYRLYGVFFILILSSLVLLAYSFHYSKIIFPQLKKKNIVPIDKKRVIKFFSSLIFISISGIFLASIDTFLLGIFLKPEFVGYYKAAFSLINGIVGLLSSANIIFLPLFTKLEKSALYLFLNQIIKRISIIIIPSTFGILALGNYFIKFFYGSLYMPATFPLYVFSFLIFPMVLINIFSYFFAAKEKPEIFAKISMITCLISGILILLFVKIFSLVSPLLAIVSVAFAVLISWTFYFLMLYNQLKEKFNLKISFRCIVRPLIASLIMSGALIFSLFFIEDMTFMKGVTEVLLGVSVYFVVMLLIRGIRKEDLNLLKFLRY